MHFPFGVTDRKALKYLIIPIVQSRRAWNWWQNLPVETFQSVREDNLFKQTVVQTVKRVFHLLTVWNHRNIHVNGKQPWNHNILPSAILFYNWIYWNDVTTRVDILKIKNIISGKFIHSLCLNFKIGNTKK
jgi:hypothetical protein